VRGDAERGVLAGERGELADLDGVAAGRTGLVATGKKIRRRQQGGGKSSARKMFIKKFRPGSNPKSDASLAVRRAVSSLGNATARKV